jgi:hypothetical protein
MSRPLSDESRQTHVVCSNSQCKYVVVLAWSVENNTDLHAGIGYNISYVVDALEIYVVDLLKEMTDVVDVVQSARHD